MTIQLAYQRLLAQLYEIYDKREAASIADMVIEHVTGQRKIERIIYKELPVNSKQQTQLEQIADELLQHRPIQYVLGEAWFMEIKLSVNKHVLIPRPETEELVQWVLDDLKKSVKKDLSLLDIGTGSGCIALAVKKKMPLTQVFAVDVSSDALQVAKTNAMTHNLAIDFRCLNFLNVSEWNQLGKYHIIVSNPPYIAEAEKAIMQDNVVKYEPSLALFVPDENALIFHEAIAEFGCKHLKANGSVYVEINEAFGKDVVDLFQHFGFKTVLLKKDMQGKDRMLKATIS